VIGPTAGAGTLEPFVNGSSVVHGNWTVGANSPLLVPDDGTNGLQVALGSAIGTTVLVTVSTIGHAGLQLSADVGRGTSLGAWGASVSTDGVSWTNIGGFPTAFGWSQGVFDLSSLTSLDDQPTVIFRLSTGSGSSSGNFANGNLDNVVVEATSVIPEPTTALLLATGLAGLAAAGRRRSLH